MVKEIDAQDNGDTQGNWGQRAVSLPWAWDLNCVVHDFDLWSSFDFTNFASCGMAYPPSLCQPGSDCLYYSLHFLFTWSALLQILLVKCLITALLSLMSLLFENTHTYTPLIKLTPYSIKDPGPYLDILYSTFHAVLSKSLVSHLPKTPGTVFCFTIPFLSCLMAKCS